MDGRPPVQRVRHFGVQPGLDVGSAAEKEPGPRERVGRRLVTGEKDGHRLVAHLVVRHPRAVVFVLGGQQHRQQVAAIAAARSSIRDHAIDDGVEARPRHPGSSKLGHRKTLEHFAERQHRHPERFHHGGQRLAYCGRLLLDVDVEQRPADNRQRQPVHLASDVERRAVGPRAPHAVGIADHQVAVSGHAIAVKRGLHQAPLPQVERAFAGQQTLAEQALASFEPPALGEIPVVRDEHVANQLRLVDEEQLFAGHPVRRDVAVRARELREEVERVRAAWTVDERLDERELRTRCRRGNSHQWVESSIPEL